MENWQFSNRFWKDILVSEEFVDAHGVEEEVFEQSCQGLYKECGWQISYDFCAIAEHYFLPWNYTMN